ncbi:MAG: ABC transporter permease [Actinomycetia bacterium]|nr:ABC transporter permease [Actinomycetes bacterium]
MQDIKKKRKSFKLTDTIILLVILIALVAFFSLMNRQFIAYNNISTMLKNMVLTGVLALGLTPLMIARGLDISFGSSISMISVIMALLYTFGGMNLWLTLLIGVLIATFIGFINGLIIESFDLIPIILTLGMMAILQALALVIANTFAETYSILMLTDQLYYFATRTFFKIPYPLLVLIVMTAIYWFILAKTKVGRTIYLIGANPTVAKLSGVKVKKVKILLYTFMGMATGIGAVLIVAITGVGMSFHGSKLPLPTLSAVLLGGISLMGGSGSVWGTIIGVLIVTVIFNGLSVLNVPSYYIQLFQGLALIIIVAAYEIRNKRAALH